MELLAFAMSSAHSNAPGRDFVFSLIVKDLVHLGTTTPLNKHSMILFDKLTAEYQKKNITHIIFLDPPKGAFWRFFNVQKPPINTPSGGCWFFTAHFGTLRSKQRAGPC